MTIITIQKDKPDNDEMNYNDKKKLINLPV
jgi:hypothetical protein